MMYHGKLYGKLWDKYFDTNHTTDEWDAMEKRIKELEAENEKLKQVNGDSTSQDQALNLADVTTRYLIEAVENKRVVDYTIIKSEHLIDGYKALFKEEFPNCDVYVAILNGW